MWFLFVCLQATLIESQAKRLDELDRLYRDEALARKKTHNAMEDLKVCGALKRPTIDVETGN